jgi:amidohydrolase
MIEAGVLDDPRVDEVYGLHFMTNVAAGRVEARPGPTFASCDYFSIEVRGQGGHGAMPHLSVDPMVAAANILLGISTLVAREVPAQDTAVMTVGQIASGTKGNIIPDAALMRGTLRAYEERV